MKTPYQHAVSTCEQLPKQFTNLSQDVGFIGWCILVAAMVVADAITGEGK